MKTFILSNNNGMNAEVTNYGGRIMRLMVPDRDGKMQDVVLGFDTAEDATPTGLGRDVSLLKDGRTNCPKTTAPTVCTVAPRGGSINCLTWSV